MIKNDFDAYIEKYIEGYLFADLQTMFEDVDKDRHPGNMAYLFVIALCSAIEFLGLLLRGGSPVQDDRVDASLGFAHYVAHYMKPIESKYLVLQEIGPRLIRNGIAHAYATKGNVAITRIGDREGSHLIRYTAEGTLVINADYFYKDFLESYNKLVKPKMIPGGELRERVVHNYEAIRNVYKNEVERAADQTQKHFKNIPWLYQDISLDSPDEELEANGGPILVS